VTAFLGLQRIKHRQRLAQLKKHPVLSGLVYAFLPRFIASGMVAGTAFHVLTKRQAAHQTQVTQQNRLNMLLTKVTVTNHSDDYELVRRFVSACDASPGHCQTQEEWRCRTLNVGQVYYSLLKQLMMQPLFVDASSNHHDHEHNTPSEDTRLEDCLQRTERARLSLIHSFRTVFVLSYNHLLSIGLVKPLQHHSAPAFEVTHYEPIADFQALSVLCGNWSMALFMDAVLPLTIAAIVVEPGFSEDKSDRGTHSELAPFIFFSSLTQFFMRERHLPHITLLKELGTAPTPSLLRPARTPARGTPSMSNASLDGQAPQAMADPVPEAAATEDHARAHRHRDTETKASGAAAGPSPEANVEEDHQSGKRDEAFVTTLWCMFEGVEPSRYHPTPEDISFVFTAMCEFKAIDQPDGCKGTGPE